MSMPPGKALDDALMSKIVWRKPAAPTGENVNTIVHTPPAASTVPAGHMFALTLKPLADPRVLLIVRGTAPPLLTVIVWGVELVPMVTEPKSSVEGAKNAAFATFEKPWIVVVNVVVPSV